VKLILAAPFILTLLLQTADARIRNRKVKEAPKSCKIMPEDTLLSRDGKKVLGTLRHSLLIETPSEEEAEAQQTISLVKDKGEKICQWTALEWKEILQNNKIENLSNFSFYVDEYKEVLYPFAKNADNSFFVMSIPFNSCEFATQSTRESLDLPKCEIPRKKAKRKKSKKNSIARK
jgi:hypothetical protein